MKSFKVTLKDEQKPPPGNTGEGWWRRLLGEECAQYSAVLCRDIFGGSMWLVGNFFPPMRSVLRVRVFHCQVEKTLFHFAPMAVFEMSKVYPLE